jgi:hypothetical protein
MAPFLPSNTIGALSSVCAGRPPLAEPHETSASAATVIARMRMGMA